MTQIKKTEMERCESCRFCTQRMMTADQQIGLCVEPHVFTKDASGNPRKQVRLWQQACNYYAQTVPEKKEPFVKMKRGEKVKDES